VLLEVLDRIGPSVLEGTAFDNESCPAKCATGYGEIPQSIRQQLVEYVHMLEAEDACASEECTEICDEDEMFPIGHTIAVDPPCPPCPVVPYAMPTPNPYAAPPQAYASPPAYYPPAPYVATAVPCPAAGHNAAISALRDAAETLERTAAQLERHDLYDSADLTREMAGQLRLESRQLQRLERESLEGKSKIETTTHHESAVDSSTAKGANQAWYFGGIRVAR
jgi:hypothetical protein